MTQQEFTQRTKVEVSYKEFDAINEVYMNSEVDKDTFCKMWVKMNAKRVANAIKAQKQKEANEALLRKLSDIANKNYSTEQYGAFAHDILNKKEIAAINKAGISMNTRVYNVCFNTYHDVPATLSNVIYSVRKAIGAIA